MPFALADLLDAEPDGQDATHDRDLLGLDEVRDGARLRMCSREDLRRTHHEASIGNTPGIGVEHRHHVQDDVLFGQRQGVRLRHAEAVEVDGAVRVDHAFRVPGRAGRVAHARGGAFVKLRPVCNWCVQAEEVLIREDAGRDLCLRHVLDEHTLTDRGERLPDGLEERPDTGADEEHAVFGVIGENLQGIS